jgi:hypothetical protein
MDAWPVHWEKMRQTPWKIGPARFIKSFFHDLVVRRREGFDVVLEDTLATAIHQLLMAWTFAWLRFIRSFRLRKSK